MAKGDYELPTLVTCLLILVLQIHNPFQRTYPSTCHCDGGGTAASASIPVNAGSRSVGKSSEASQGPSPPPGAPSSRGGADPAPVYRRPREVVPSAPAPGGLSTDALLRELDSIQAKAKEQQDTLAAAGRMPPPSPILQHLKETEAAEGGAAMGGMRTDGRGAAQASMAQMPSAPPPSMQSWGGVQAESGSTLTAAAGPGGAPLLRRRDDLGRFLEARQPRGLGVVLGVGRGDFALQLLGDWVSAQGVYLVDPYIHVWQGYDDPANLSDREHQLVFEELRSRLTPFEGKYVLVRDFSHSFAEVYRSGGTAPGLPTFIYIDANHAEKAVERDLNLWWPLLAPGGVLAGSTYVDDASGRIRVQTVVDRFVARQHVNLYLTHDDTPPSWFIFKE